jgi:phage tail sheath protein FI
LLTQPSAFDRINVRRLFIILEKAIAISAKYFLFEFNNVYTRRNFINMVNPYLAGIKAKQGMYDFHVQCDETNNTPEVIDGNQFVASMFIKPSRSINFITLNFVATKSGVDFSEVIGQV